MRGPWHSSVQAILRPSELTGKLRCTTWSDAVVIFPVEVLALVDIERQAHAIRAKAPASMAKKEPPAPPDLREDNFEALWPRATSSRLRPSELTGKLRCTTWSDAVVIFPVEVLALVNIERQAHAIRAKAPASMVKKEPPAPPDLREDNFEAPCRRGGRHLRDLREDDFEAPCRRGGRHPPI
jgi:hypothetical protein